VLNRQKYVKMRASSVHPGAESAETLPTKSRSSGDRRWFAPFGARRSAEDRSKPQPALRLVPPGLKRGRHLDVSPSQLCFRIELNSTGAF
jgi:hypothetical protein